MGFADQHLPFGAGPPIGESARSPALGLNSNLGNTPRMGRNRDPSHIYSPAVSSREPSADNRISTESLGAFHSVTATPGCGCRPTPSAVDHDCSTMDNSQRNPTASRASRASVSSSRATTGVSKSWVEYLRSSARGVPDPDRNRPSQRFRNLETPRHVPNNESRDTPRGAERDQPNPQQSEPETRSISQEQLVAEVKGIYAGLVMVEKKRIEVDMAQTTDEHLSRSLNNDQWHALIALHRTLLREHHDFFLASQHPSSSLERLAAKYRMPARMWRHGIHSFLELLRHKSPDSSEPRLTFIHIAYSVMALLYETVPAFEDTWIECLGDLGRYRMAIEDDDIRGRETWISVARYWYTKAFKKSHTVGRLYHHLATPARPNALPQLYQKSLSIYNISHPKRESSIRRLLDPVVEPNHVPSTFSDAEFIRVYEPLLSDTGADTHHLSLHKSLLRRLLDNHITRTTREWLMPGSQDASSAEIVFQRFGDPNILPYMHITLAFICNLAYSQAAITHVEGQIPWKLISTMLNTLSLSWRTISRIEDQEFPIPARGSDERPLPEDFAMRGLLWTDQMFPDGQFHNKLVDDDERYFEVEGMTKARAERIAWLGYLLHRNLQYDFEARKFGSETIPDTTSTGQHGGLLVEATFKKVP